MRPAIFIMSLQLVVAALAKHCTHCHMHQVLLLLFGYFSLYKTCFLHAYQKKNGFHIGLFAKALHHFRLQCPPPLLQIITYIHRRKGKVCRQRLYLPAKRIYMLQVTLLKQKPDWVKEKLAVKNFKQPELVDEIIA